MHTNDEESSILIDSSMFDHILKDKDNKGPSVKDKFKFTGAPPDEKMQGGEMKSNERSGELRSTPTTDMDTRERIRNAIVSQSPPRDRPARPQYAPQIAQPLERKATPAAKTSPPSADGPGLVSQNSLIERNEQKSPVKKRVRFCSQNESLGDSSS